MTKESPKKTGRTKIGKEVRVNATIRIEPSIREKIIKVYGSMTNFVNDKIKRDRKLK